MGPAPLQQDGEGILLEVFQVGPGLPQGKALHGSILTAHQGAVPWAGHGEAQEEEEGRQGVAEEGDGPEGLFRVLRLNMPALYRGSPPRECTPAYPRARSLARRR